MPRRTSAVSFPAIKRGRRLETLYILTGDVLVPAGVTLTIEAGVNVTASVTDDQLSGNDTSHVEFIVIGGLQVNGTLLSRVTFSSELPQARGSWGGIDARPGTGLVSINYASISSARVGVRTSRHDASVTVNHVHFHFFYEAGVLAEAGEPQILASLFTDGGTGVRAGSSAEPVIANNLMIMSNGIELVQNVPTTTYISNNTIVTGFAAVLVQPGAGSGLNAIITNNIITHGGGFSRGIFVAEPAPAVVVTLAHNNVVVDLPYYGVAPGPSDLSVDPQFVSNTDFHLVPTSPMIDAGTGPANAPLVDFDDVTRPIGAGWDIGAYEFLPAVLPPTANAGPDQTFSAGAGGTATVTISGLGTAPAGSTLTLSMD